MIHLTWCVASRRRSVGEHLVSLGWSCMDLHGRMEGRRNPLQNIQVLSSKKIVFFFCYLHRIKVCRFKPNRILEKLCDALFVVKFFPHIVSLHQSLNLNRMERLKSTSCYSCILFVIAGCRCSVCIYQRQRWYVKTSFFLCHNKSTSFSLSYLNRSW